MNTCSVTATADQGARQTIRRIARDNPARAHRRHRLLRDAAARRCRRAAECGAVVCNDDKPRLLQLIRSSAAFASAGASSAAFARGDGPCGAAIEPGVAGRTAFTLRVQTGCDEPCSYCIIPSTRGAPRSVPLADVLREIDRVAAAGFKEIALTGVHLGSYGRDLSPRVVDLLRALDGARLPHVDVRAVSHLLARADGLLARYRRSGRRVRLFRAALPPAAAAREQPHPRVDAPAVHDRVLRSTRRRYPRAHPAASIGTDVIVGFPGETDTDIDISRPTSRDRR